MGFVLTPEEAHALIDRNPRSEKWTRGLCKDCPVPRIQRDALIYGTETLPSGSLSAAKDVHAPAAGITRWQQAGQTLLLHYSPFGGEHDHMARGHLGLWRNGREILPDRICGI